MGKLHKRYISFVLIVTMIISTILPINTISYAQNSSENKFTEAKPAVFNPYNGEITRIRWNFEHDQIASITIYDGTKPVKVIEEAGQYPGNFVMNEEIWDGKDDDGDIVPNGIYEVKIQPLNPKWAEYPSITTVAVADEASEDIAIFPNVYEESFMVYGTAEENTTKVELFINGMHYQNASVRPGQWSLEIPLPDYEEVEITAVKTNMVPKEVTDSEGNTEIVYEREELDLGPIHVLKHRMRPYDTLPAVAGYYYENSKRYHEIINFNGLMKPYNVSIGCNLLVLDPEKDGEPPISEFADPENMDKKCGIVDLMSGKTEFSADPVNLATGNYIYTYGDMSIFGNFPIYFVRFYNSRDEYNGNLGMNWHHNFEYRLQDMGNGTVKIIFDDGHREEYRLKGNGVYESEPGNYNKLEKNTDQTYILTLPDKTKYHFNERGQLTNIKDGNENVTKLVYEDLLLREIRTDSGYLLIQYYKDARISEISDNTGRTVKYTYDGDDLVSYKNPEGNITQYEYDSKHQITKVTSPLKNGSLINLYDDKGRVIEQTLEDGSKMYFHYDESNRMTTLTERDGAKFIYTYDENYRITEITYSDGMEKNTFNDRGQKTSYTDKNGNMYIYEYDDKGNLTRVKDPLQHTTEYIFDETNNITSIIQADGQSYNFVYDSKGNVISATDPVGRKVAYEYNKNGLPVKITKPDGSILYMNYDNKGNVTEIIDVLGNKTKFEYDNVNRLKARIEPKGNKTIFEYTGTDEIKKIIDAKGNSVSYKYNKNGKLEEIIDQSGNITKYKYDQADQLIEIIDPLHAVTKFEYDSKGNLIKVIDANNSIMQYNYDTFGRIMSVVDAENYISSYDYDLNGNLIKQIDPNGNITEYSYDALNQLIKIIDANKNETNYTYDPLGRVTKVIDTLNYTNEYEYYPDGQLKTAKDALGNTVSFTYNSFGLVETVTNEAGAVTTYDYNSNGDMIKMIDPEGAVTQWEYDNNGNVIKVIDANGNETKYTYDELNRVNKATDALGNTQTIDYTKTGEVAAVTDQNKNKTTYRYDSIGNLIEVIDAKGHKTNYVYDAVGNLIQIHKYRAEDTSDTLALSLDNELKDEKAAENEEIAEDIAEEVSIPESDQPNQEIGDETEEITEDVIDENGDEEVLATENDPLNNETEEEKTEGTEERVEDTTNDDAQEEIFAVEDTELYTDDAKIAEITDLQETSFTYDKRGLVKKVEDASGKIEVYEYDGNGNLISVEDKDGYKTAYEYDPTNLLKKIDYNHKKQVEFKYNPLGQLVEMKDWNGTTKFAVDPLGRVSQVTDFQNRVIQYSYLPTGEKESIIYPDSSKVNYEYDKLGRLTSVTDAFGKNTNYKYDKVGNILEKTFANNAKTIYEYDSVYNIKELKQIDPQMKILNRYRYSYDPAGNKIKVSKENDDVDEDGQEQILYQYDELNQLIEVTRNNEERRKYFYDTLGNRIKMQTYQGTTLVDEVNYQYDKLNRLIQVNDKEEDKQYIYDNRGNLIQRRTEGKIFNEYEFDETNSLVEVINKHGDVTKYFYDGFGNRIKTIVGLDHPGGDNRPEKPENSNGNAYGHDKENPGNAYGHDKAGNPHPGWGQQNKRDYMEQNFVVDITSPYNDVLMIYGDHYQIQRYTYGFDRISMDMWMLEDDDNGWIPNERETHLSQDPERLYYLQDELGSTIRLIGEDGRTSAHYNYDEFGRPLSSEKFDQNWPGPDNTFGYTGYQYDVSSGLYYAQARYYMPEIGRFISEDSYKGEITNPLSLNYYIYCENNPLIYIDPDGHECGAINIPDKNYNISIKEWADTGLFIITFMPTPAGAAAKAGAKVTQVIVKGSITRKAANKIISLGSKNGPGAVKRVLGNRKIVRTGKAGNLFDLQLFAKNKFPSGSISGKNVIKFLKKEGFKEVSQNGSHVKLKGPNGNVVTVPKHANKALPKGTLESIKKQAGYK